MSLKIIIDTEYIVLFQKMVVPISNDEAQALPILVSSFTLGLKDRVC
jgi:hypothetical protein